MNLNEVKTIARSLMFGCIRGNHLRFWDNNPELAEMQVSSDRRSDEAGFNGTRHLERLEFVSDAAKVQFALRLGIINDEVYAPLVDGTLRIGHWLFMIEQELEISSVADTFDSFGRMDHQGASCVYRRDKAVLHKAQVKLKEYLLCLGSRLIGVIETPDQ
jgi:hypothetical protein